MADSRLGVHTFIFQQYGFDHMKRTERIAETVAPKPDLALPNTISRYYPEMTTETGPTQRSDTATSS